MKKLIVLASILYAFGNAHAQEELPYPYNCIHVLPYDQHSLFLNAKAMDKLFEK